MNRYHIWLRVICNDSSLLGVDLVLFGFSLERSFKTRLLGRGFHTLIKGDLFSFPTDVGYHNSSPSGLNVLVDTSFFLQLMWDPHKIHPLRGPASLLAHHLVSTSLREPPSRWHIT